MSSPVPSPFFLFGEIIIFGRDAAGVRDGHDHGGRNQGLGSLMGTRWTMDALCRGQSERLRILLLGMEPYYVRSGRKPSISYQLLTPASAEMHLVSHAWVLCLVAECTERWATFKHLSITC
jgi:hypothetical protein